MSTPQASRDAWQRALASLDRADAALGPRSAWSAALRSAWDVVQAAPLPAALTWGPERIVLFNPACLDWLGAAALGDFGARAAHTAHLTRLVGLAPRATDPSTQARRGTLQLPWPGSADGGNAGMLHLRLPQDASLLTPRRGGTGEASFCLGTLDQAGVGISLADREGNIVFGNAAFLGITGHPPGAPGPRSFRELTADDDWPRCLELLERMLQDDIPFALEKRLRRTDGSWVWVRNQVSPWKDDGGRTAGAVVVTIDLTERFEAETALRESEQRFRVIVENARDYAIFSIDPAGTVTDWLAGAEAVFGWTADEIVGRSFAELFTPEDRANHVPEAEIATARTCESAPDVRWHQRKNGERVFIEGKTVAMRGADGTLRGFLKIGQDVTERRQADEALRLSERRFRQFSDASADILWIRHAGTLQFEHVSPAFESVYGVARGFVSGGDDFLHWAELICPQDRDAAVDNVKLAAGGCSFVHEFRIERRSDREVRWIRDSLFPLHDESGAICAVGGIGEDVTEAKRNSDRLTILNSELQHRTRNLIAVVRALAHSTLEVSASLDDFNLRFMPRLDALSRVQGLLSRATGGSVDFEQLLRAELNAHGGLEPGRPLVELRGTGAVELLPNSVQTVALALHELTTNAVKYGALAQAGARLRVDWELRRGSSAGPERLYVAWRESGVRMPAPGEHGIGYGRELIEHALPYQLGASTHYELTPDGVHCTIDLPIGGD